MEGFYKNDKIAVLRQDKGRGVVIINIIDYVNKYGEFLNGPEFESLSDKFFQDKCTKYLEKNENEIYQS